MLIKVNTKVNIKESPQKIWDFANDPDNWTASNPEEHFGLEFDNKENRPKEGVGLYQKEKVAGVYADLRGHIPYADIPNVLVWRGIAAYHLLGGIIKYRLPEGGVVKLHEGKDGTKMTHDYYMDFPDTLLGKLLYWYFENKLNGEELLYDHGQKELDYFKEKLENE